MTIITITIDAIDFTGIIVAIINHDQCSGWSGTLDSNVCRRFLSPHFSLLHRWIKSINHHHHVCVDDNIVPLRFRPTAQAILSRPQ